MGTQECCPRFSVLCHSVRRNVPPSHRNFLSTVRSTVRPGSLRTALRNLFRVGPFLSEIPPSGVAGFGHGCAFRNTTYWPSDYAQPSGKYGLPLHHPWFLEWIGAPKSARLLDKGPSAWLHSLSGEQAIDAARQLHRDVCLMTTNLNILDQYVLWHGVLDFGTNLGFPGHSVCGSGCERYGSPGLPGFRSYGGHGSLALFAETSGLSINAPGTIVVEVFLVNGCCLGH